MPNQNPEQKVKELEQRVAAPEGQVQEQLIKTEIFLDGKKISQSIHEKFDS